MSVREQLVKSLSMILRLNKATLQVLLADANGLSIAKVSRSSDIDIDAVAINSVSAATYNFSDEIWRDLGILPQRISFAFFEKICLINIRIEPIILTIVHDFNASWPINADEIGKIIYQLKIDIDEMFNPGMKKEDNETFSTFIRNILYLFNMGNEIPEMIYLPPDGTSSPEIHDQISTILDSVQNPVFGRYSIVAQDGLMLDGRDTMPSVSVSLPSFAASMIVAFQRLVEEAATLNAGPLLNYICISGSDAQSLFATVACPSGILYFKDSVKRREIKAELAFITIFALTYGMIPVFCEIRNIVKSVEQALGEDSITSAFLNSVNNLIKIKYQ
ncbi:MAG TPA: hypothetical protein VKM55_26745 [Candidatus Lokiarchaeia archaeon]|nr:hypothetical protein [Candidatus Lokiarchaeia archaeon]